MLLFAACTGPPGNNGGGDGSPVTPERTSPEAEATPDGPQRSFALGFTDFPHELSIAALLEAYEVIERDGDLAVLHLDGGVPWPDALAGQPFPRPWRDEIEGKAGIVPRGHLVYLAVTPISRDRNGLALYRGESANEALPAPWDGYAFDHPDVVEAYGAYVEGLIELLDPDYLAYAIEANMLYDKRPDLWEDFLSLIQATYERLKAAHPSLPLIVTLQAEWFHRDPSGQAAAIQDLLPYTDMVAVSSYPFIDQPDLEALPEDYFSAIASLAPEKPFAIAETGWPAQDVDAPYPRLLPGSEAAQRAYVERLLDEAEALHAEFVTWFFSRDYDAQWEQFMSTRPDAATLRIWRDNGLYDGADNPRPALAVWREALRWPLVRWR